MAALPHSRGRHPLCYRGRPCKTNPGKTMMRKGARLLLSSIIILAIQARAEDIAIHAGTLIDGTGAAPRSQVTIRVHDDTIVGVDAGYTTPAGARVIDLSDRK